MALEAARVPVVPPKGNGSKLQSQRRKEPRAYILHTNTNAAHDVMAKERLAILEDVCRGAGYCQATGDSLRRAIRSGQFPLATEGCQLSEQGCSITWPRP
eukprot:scaffold122446_cov26-Tisochrysis_lutea.AAC.1